MAASSTLWTMSKKPFNPLALYLQSSLYRKKTSQVWNTCCCITLRDQKHLIKEPETCDYDLCFVREKGHCICSANWLSNRLQRFISLDYEKGDLQGNICWYVFNIFITIFVNQIPFCLLGCSKILQTGFFKTKSHTAEFTAIHAYSIFQYVTVDK